MLCKWTLLLGDRILYYSVNQIVIIIRQKYFKKMKKKHLPIRKKVVLLHPQSKTIKFFFWLVR